MRLIVPAKNVWGSSRGVDANCAPEGRLREERRSGATFGDASERVQILKEA